MNQNWNNKTIVITGAYGGLGNALAIALSNLGADLVLVGRNSTKLNALVDKLPGKVAQVVGDITDFETMNQLSRILQSKSNKFHILINNAALSGASFLANSTPSDLTDTIKVNLLAPMQLTHKLLPWLKCAENGQIVNIGSSFGGIGYPGFSAYCASKFGLRGFTQALNRELSGSSVKAQYLAPRAMSTDINSAAVNALNTELGNKVDAPEKIAQCIVKSIEKEQAEKFYGWPEKFFIKLNSLTPNIVSKAIKKDQPTIQSLLNKEV